MKTGPQSGMTPQARGRELASQGKKLWAELGSVKAAAAELMNRYRDVPSLQAFRYAAGLSQDQAAMRYNEVTGHQTSLGGTSINAWETWARARGSGSPPPFASLLILAIAYGRGPLGISDEELPPGELVADAYERLPPEDQLAARAFSGRGAVLGTTSRDRHSDLAQTSDAAPAVARSPGRNNAGTRAALFFRDRARPGCIL